MLLESLSIFAENTRICEYHEIPPLQLLLCSFARRQQHQDSQLAPYFKPPISMRLRNTLNPNNEQVNYDQCGYYYR